MAKQKISIIVPVYNAEKYLERCIKSLINQTYPNLEIILINDGSIDDSAKICDNYAKIDNRIIVIHKENEGVSKARNLGMKKATGDYITFIDSDDFIEINTYNEIFDELKKDFDIIVFGYKVIKSRKNCDKIVPIKREYFDENKEFLIDAYSNNYFSCVWNKLYSKKLCKSVQFDEKLKFGEDFKFNLEITQQSQSIYSIDKTFHHYIVYENPNSLSKSEKLEKIIDIYNQQYELLLNYLGKQTCVYNKYAYSIYCLLRNYLKHNNDSKDKQYQFVDKIYNNNLKESLYNCRMKNLKEKIAKFILNVRNKKFRLILLKLI